MGALKNLLASDERADLLKLMGDISTARDEYREEVYRLREEKAAMLEALKALQLQALQSTVNHPSNEWGREAILTAAAVIKKAEGK